MNKHFCKQERKMACEGINSWTFPELVAAFVDLSIAYCSLCASAFFFFASKLLALFGLCLPCPCDGLFWNPRNNNTTTQCLQRQLSDFTYEKISLVHSEVRSKPPFDQSLFVRDSDRETENNGESGSVTFSSEQRELSKPRRGFRRRRSGGSGKISAVRSYDTVRSDAQNAPRSPPSVSNKRNAGSEDDFYSFETDSFPNRNEEEDRSALYAELEKERSAAASAADEAMAMISRLQEEKASVEMEARQYQRMIEAKAAYDAEEMEILKEILLRREREKHFLENEVEAYRQMYSAADHEDHTPIMVKGSLDYEVTTSVRSLARTLAFDSELDIPELDDPVSKILEIGGPASPDRSSGKDPPESHVYDVHVIGAEPRRFGSSRFTDLSKSSSDGMPPRREDLRRNASMSAVDYERVRLDGEVEWLRERLRIVQKGRENLNFSVGSGEREKLQLQLLEDIAGQLREIRRIGDPGNVDRQASLPPSYSKAPLKRRRWRSGSLNINQST